MNTAIYVRVSTEEQAKEGYSIRAQIDKLKSYIEIKDWTFYKVYADEGISGKNITDRPAINELITDIKARRVNNVLVYKIDRLTRSTRDLIELTELFINQNCAFNSLMESIDTKTASGRMFLKIIGIFAEFERENIIERISLACEKKVREGYTLGTFTTSYGYDRAPGEKVQTINPVEAEIVREIYAMYLEGNMSFNEIARNLNHRNIKTKLGATWSQTTIGQLFRNPNYIGKVRYGMEDKDRYFEAEGKHEAIISEELYYQAQNKMAKIRKKTFTKRPKDDHYYSGTLYCGECGKKLCTHGEYKTSATGEKIVNAGYRCPNKARGLCSTARFAHPKVESAFQEYMASIPDISVADEVGPEEKSKRDSINGLIREEYENAIAKVAKKEKDVMALYLKDRISFEDYERMLEVLASEKAEYIERLENIPTEPDGDIILTRKEIMTNFRDNWTLLTNAEKLQFLQDYIERITAVSKKEEGQGKNMVKVLKVKFYDG